MAISFQKDMTFLSDFEDGFLKQAKVTQRPIPRWYMSPFQLEPFFSASKITNQLTKTHAELPGYTSGSLTGPKRKVFHLPTLRISDWTLQWKGQIEPVKTQG